MKKILLGLFAVSSLAYGADYLSLRAEATTPARLTIENNENYTKEDTMSGAGYAFAFESMSRITNRIHFGTGIGYQVNGSLEGENEKNGVPALTSVPVYVTLKYRFGENMTYIPYIKGDFGYSYNNVESNNTYEYGSGLYYGAAVGVDVSFFSFEMGYKMNTGSVKGPNGSDDFKNERVYVGAAFNIF